MPYPIGGAAVTASTGFAHLVSFCQSRSVMLLGYQPLSETYHICVTPTMSCAAFTEQRHATRAKPTHQPGKKLLPLSRRQPGEGLGEGVTHSGAVTTASR